MKSRDNELVDVKAKSRQNEEVCLITSKPELKLTDPPSPFL
jgi:hypothetical protein